MVMITEEWMLSKGVESIAALDGVPLHKNCAMTFVTTEGRVVVSRHQECHGALNAVSHYLGELDVPACIVTRIQTESKGFEDQARGALLCDEFFFKYYDFLLNRSVFKDCYVSKDATKIKSEGVVVRCDRPASLMACACIAIRRGWEMPDVARSLVRMLEAGVESWKAEICSYLFHVRKDLSLEHRHYGEHSAIYSKSLDKYGILNFKQGKLGNSRKCFCSNTREYKDTKSYRYLSSMWSDGVVSCTAEFNFNLSPRCRVMDPFEVVEFERTASSVKKVGLVEMIDAEFDRVLQ